MSRPTFGELKRRLKCGARALARGIVPAGAKLTIRRSSA